MKSIVLILALILGPAAAALPDGGERLLQVNAALKLWLQAIEANTPYLLVDRGTAEMRLMHGKAVMRNITLVADSLTARPPMHLFLQHHLRRYRPSDPWVGLAASAFDWEQNLVAEAAATGALYFTGGLLLYADPIWHRGDAIALRVQEGDLRALYNACEPGLQLIVLPAGWREGRGL